MVSRWRGSMKKKLSVRTEATAVTSAGISPRRIATNRTASRYSTPSPAIGATLSNSATRAVAAATAAAISTRAVAVRLNDNAGVTTSV